MQARVQRAGNSTTTDHANARRIEPGVYEAGRDHSPSLTFGANSSTLQVRSHSLVKCPVCSAVTVVEYTEVGREGSAGADGPMKSDQYQASMICPRVGACSQENPTVVPGLAGGVCEGGYEPHE